MGTTSTLSAVSPCGSYPTGASQKGFTQTRCLWGSRELQLNPGSPVASSARMSQIPCMGYLVPQIPHAENPQPNHNGISRSFALTWTITQLCSGYAQEFCSGINYNATTVIWSEVRLGLPSSPPHCIMLAACRVRPRDPNSVFTQHSLRSNPGRNSLAHATFLCKSMGTVESGLKSGFQDLTQFNLGINSCPTVFFFFFWRLNN